jgi:tRNA A-37 threonylcarbamoyl transferase component Bud32
LYNQIKIIKIVIALYSLSSISLNKYIKMKEILNFDKLRLRYQPTNIKVFKAYLCDIFNDLYRYKQNYKKKKMHKDTFVTYIGFPYILGERIFSIFAKGNSNTIPQTDFVEGLVMLYCGSLAEIQEIIFKIFDFNCDGLIVMQDIRLILSFLYRGGKDQRQTDHYINDLIDKFFMGNHYMNFDDFTKVVENKFSDIFLILICFIYEYKFYDDKLLEIYGLDRSRVETVLADYTHKGSSGVSKRELVVPTFISKGDFGVQIDFKRFVKGETINDNEMYEELRELENFEIGEIALEPMIVRSGINFIDYKTTENDGNLLWLRGLENTASKILALDTTNYVSTKATANTNLGESLIQMPEGDIEDYVYNLTKGKKKFWLVLCGKDLLYFKKENKFTIKGLHNLANAYLNDSIKDVIRNNIKFNHFSIIFPEKERLLGFKNLQQCKRWLSILKTNLNHRCIENYYKQQQLIGKGSYGIVKLGQCKQTGQRVAIKILEKERYKDKVNLIKNELEILKFCRHANIVQYIDSFETHEYIYIVTEYLSSDLLSYLEFNKTSLSENRVKQIIKQIALGVEYLHSHGIMHRDLKPMNILVSDFGAYPKIKIIDFGLSRVFGYDQLFNETVGTIHFSAPELLRGKGYNYKIDLWSLGVMLYYLVLGYFPFDADEGTKNAIVKKTLGGEYVIPRSVNCHFKDLIYCCLDNDSDKRINIKGFLDHPWFNK